MGIALRKGRLFTEEDRAGNPRVALISESLERLRFPGADPIGRTLRVGPDTGSPYTIVGVVADVRQVSLAVSQSEAVYLPMTQWHWAENPMTLVIRTREEASGIVPAARQAIWSIDKDQPIVRVATMDDLVAASTAERRFSLVLFQAFALAALVLATAGIYGVVSASVAERTREIGVRAALGASRGRVLGLVVRQAMTLTGLGIAVGLAGAVAASRAIAAMLFGVSPLDPVTYLVVVAVLIVVAVIACSAPAWRAARVDPVSTLRAE
jgi:putative ABC transport system permease protein